MRYWTQFARLANPNSLLTPPWVRYFPVLLDCIQKLSLLQPYNGFNADHKCDLWTALANASTGS